MLRRQLPSWATAGHLTPVPSKTSTTSWAPYKTAALWRPISSLSDPPWRRSTPAATGQTLSLRLSSRELAQRGK
eukprot:12895116-Prorocentrum_lima.AAC.1